MYNEVKKFFTEHPKQVNETYFQHLFSAIDMTKEIFIIGGILLIHAFLPFLYQEEASLRLEKLNKKIQRRKIGKKGCSVCNCGRSG